uniref:SSD domain-containing protein n=1 Tax=Meloidogyne incognita TaxID=6306 RepID=A0A914LXA6_MELIC
MEYSTSWLSSLGQVKFSYPISKVLVYDVNIGKHIFNRSINEKGEIINATMIALYFSTFINGNSTKLFLNKFEEKVQKEAEIFNNLNKNIKIIVHGSNVVQKEIERGIINDGKIAVICYTPLIGLTILNIAHGTFQLGDIWCKLLNESKERQYSSNERLAKVFEKIGPSMFYSSLWPISAFSILSLTLTSLNYKSLFLAITLLFTYCFLFKILFFSPLLAYYCHHSVEHSLLENGGSSSLFNLNSKEINTKTNILLPPTIQQLRIPSIQNNMDYREILPKESKAIKGFDIMDLIWNDFLQILFIIQTPPNFEDFEQFGEFKEFLHEATSLNQTLQPSAHMSWLFDYYKDKFNENILQNIKINNSKFTFVNMSKFDSFINNFPYNAWKSGVRYKIIFDENKNKSSVLINKMLILFAYGNTKGLSGKRKLINECRSVAKRYPQFKINIFDTDLKTTDLMNLIEIIIFSDFWIFQNFI